MGKNVDALAFLFLLCFAFMTTVSAQIFGVRDFEGYLASQNKKVRIFIISTGIQVSLRQSVLVHVLIDARRLNTRSHACSFARNVASSADVFLLALMATKKSALVIIIGRPKGVAPSALEISKMSKRSLPKKEPLTIPYPQSRDDQNYAFYLPLILYYISLVLLFHPCCKFSKFNVSRNWTWGSVHF
ncbi:hypothetical protein RJ641_033313 [Dillenia turbinata]|uniref:Uncharacterized protein n=1 Tax=Dillenia turbinata TaxID=194707 RepID=A0AAN8VY10_9MAGN